MATKYCPHCQTKVTQPLQLCPQCNAMLSLKDPYSLVGRTLLNRYQIEALVGLGGMGAVYCAFHQGIERRVAFKVLQPNIALADERLVELFEREAKVAGRLTHENIVDVKDAGSIEDNGMTLAYIVMEWLDGRTLEEELQHNQQLGFAQTNEILQQMAGALAEAHSKNVVHRDLKPANVMLMNRPNGRMVVKVLDFGIGKIVNQTGASVSAVMGTPNYASPEQLQLGGKLDHRSDIYSMGVMLYRMLGGRLPFNSASLPELVQMQLTSTPTALSMLRADIPAELEALIHQMLAKDADDRPQSMIEVAQRFAAALGKANLQETVPLVTEADTARFPSSSKNGKTELMPESPTPRRIEISAEPDLLATNVMPTPSAAHASHRSKALPGALLALALAGGGFGLYRYTSNNNEVPSPTPEPSPQATQVIIAATSPTPGVAASALPAATKTPVSRNEVVKDKPLPNASAVAVPPTPAATGRNSGGLPLPSAPSTQPSGTLPPGVTDDMPVKMYLAAQQEYQNGNYQKSLAICNRILAKYPRHRAALELRRKLLAGMRVLQDKP